MLYKKNNEKNLSKELFKNPTCEYRATPFWAWNCKLEKDQLMRQIDSFKEMGFGGFHMHTRVGLETEYLGEDFMDMIKSCCKKADQNQMLAWLYDEDTWPSGFAGGKVSQNKAFRRKRLLLTTVEKEECAPKEIALKQGTPYYLATYDIEISDEGFLDRYTVIEKSDKAVGTKWYAYVVTEADTPRFNNQSYIDTTDKDAMQCFVNCTYIPYEKAVSEYFDKTVPAIFTDEPAMDSRSEKSSVSDPFSKNDILRFWSRDFEEDYKKTYSQDILEILPELFWNKKDGSDTIVKYRYYDISARRFSENFSKKLGDWCNEHGLALTGHLLNEPSLAGQAASCGETMRNYPHFGIPGIDMLCNSHEFTTAKQTQSSVHQCGKEGMLSELYGVTNWDFDFRGHKLQGDWQAALGVTVRVPHLAWVSMKGDAKRDYPAAIGYQSPWYREYSYIEDHFARLNTALTRGKPIVNVGVIHPIESYWIKTGPKTQDSIFTSSLESNFKNITEWLLKGHIDFDYICESTLPSLGSNNIPGTVGKMSYSAIVVPGCITLRKTTIEYLTEYIKRGGKVVFMGGCPKYVDGVLSDECRTIFDKSVSVNFDSASVLGALENERLVDIKNASGSNASHYIYNYRKDNDCNWLFIARNCDPNKDINEPSDIIITVKGVFNPTVYDTVTGEIYPIEFEIKNCNTVIRKTLNSHDSLLLNLSNDNYLPVIFEEKYAVKNQFDIKKRVPFTLSEPNVLLIDRAEYAFDDGEWLEEEDLLHATRAFRSFVGFQSTLPQPYIIPDEPDTHCMHIRFEIESEIDYSGALLAIEDADKIDIRVNGTAVPNNIVGYFTDESIKTIPLPDISKGITKFEIDIPFGKRTKVEWCYILGDFGVRVMGCEKIIVPLTDKIGFGDVTAQGLPFYGANITYHLDVSTETDGAIEIKTSYYRGALVTATLDGKDKKRIVFSPFKAIFENVPKGNHTVDVTVFGNRHNSFGALHLVNEKHTWFGPTAWYTTGSDRSYEYNLKKFGVLKSPVITILEKGE